MKPKRTYRVTLKRRVEYSATVKILARSQAEADRKAMAAYYEWDGDEDFPPLWHVNDPTDYEAEIDTRFRCVDCNFDTLGTEYYTVSDELWAAAKMAPHGGMLCLACLERRIGRLLVIEDFTACCPTLAAWQRHQAARQMQLSLALMPATKEERPMLTDDRPNVVKFPNAPKPEWASDVDAHLLDRLIAKGYLKHHQRHDWCAVEMAINSAFAACVFDPRPELNPQEVIEHMLKHPPR